MKLLVICIVFTISSALAEGETTTEDSIVSKRGLFDYGAAGGLSSLGGYGGYGSGYRNYGGYYGSGLNPLSGYGGYGGYSQYSPLLSNYQPQSYVNEYRTSYPNYGGFGTYNSIGYNRGLDYNGYKSGLPIGDGYSSIGYKYSTGFPGINSRRIQTPVYSGGIGGAAGGYYGPYGGNGIW